MNNKDSTLCLYKFLDALIKEGSSLLIQLPLVMKLRPNA